MDTIDNRTNPYDVLTALAKREDVSPTLILHALRDVMLKLGDTLNASEFTPSLEGFVKEKIDGRS